MSDRDQILCCWQWPRLCFPFLQIGCVIISAGVKAGRSPLLGGR